MYVIRKKLSEDEGNPPNTRYNPMCDCFEVTADGGTTWTEDPSADPRRNTALYLPAADSRCAAAAGMTAFVRKFVDDSLSLFTIVGISSSAIAIGAVWLPGIGQLVALAWALADLMIGIGSLTLQETFDEDLYDQLECIFYCNVDADGRLDQARLDQVGIDIQDDISDSNVNIVMAAMFNLYGFVGFTNAGVTYADDEADCNDCACAWCYLFDFQIGELDWSPVPLDVPPFTPGIYLSGTGWGSSAPVEDGCSGHSYLYLEFSPAAPIDELLESITVVMGGIPGGAGGNIQLWNGGSLVDIQSWSISAGNDSFTLPYPGVIATRIVVTTNRCGDTSSGEYWFESFTFTGHGENPFGEDNC